MQIEELKSQKKKVEYILQNYPEARNSDRYLIYQYTRLFYHFTEQQLELIKGFLYGLPPMDSFKRIRASFNQKGLYLGNEHVQEERRKLDTEYRKVFKGGLF